MATVLLRQVITSFIIFAASPIRFSQRKYLNSGSYFLSEGNCKSALSYLLNYRKTSSVRRHCQCMACVYPRLRRPLPVFYVSFLVGKLSYSYRSMTRDYCFLFCSISSNSHGLLQELLRKKKTIKYIES